MVTKLKENRRDADVDLERRVLANLFSSPEECSGILRELSVDDFTHPIHKRIYNAAALNQAKQLPVDFIRIRHELEQDGLRVEEAEYLGSLLSEWSPRDVLWHMVREVRAMTKQRVLWRALSDAFNAKVDGEQDANDMLLKAMREFKELDQERRDKPQHIYQSLTEYRALLKSYVDGVKPKSYTTGFPRLNEIFTYMPQCLYVVGGRPAMGKTAWALGQAGVLCKQGLRGLFVSIEMSMRQVNQRFTSTKTGIPSHVLNNGLIDEVDLERFDEFHEEFKDLNLFVAQRGMQTIDDIRWALESAPDGKPFDYLLVDYLQLLNGDDPKASREQIVGDNSWNLKLIAQEFDIPVIILVQLNRNVTNKQDKRPGLADIRDSGRIEQDADMCLFIHREGYYDSDGEIPEDDTEGNRCYPAELIVAKNRHGKTGTVIVGWRPDRTVFTRLKNEVRNF